MKMKKIFSLLTLGLFLTSFSQTGKLRRMATVGFYNVENLWDTIQSADYIDGTLPPNHPRFHRSVPIDSVKYLEREDYKGEWSDSKLIGRKVVRFQGSSEEFTPKSAKNYNTSIYNQKLTNAARVISELGASVTKTAPVVVGLLEVENRQVVEDLVKQPALKKFDYGVIHYNSYDYRGIDVALIYQKRRFSPTYSTKKELKIYNEEGRREYTRDLLVVSGYLDGEKVTFFVNHWPSRRGGEAVSLPKRNAAAQLLRAQMDSVRALDANTKLIAMGDFNDDPISSSLKNYLKAVGSTKELSPEYPYLNLMYPLYKKGVASLAYRDAPNLFDQIIVSENLVSPKDTSYSVFRTEVYAPAYLINKEGSFKGYPFRSWNGDKFTGGYSDHFPVFTILSKEVN
ncbi:endonuclease/exonuclease/phosphatase family protein [Riemerella anatipestifer]|uniref:endonuclease/exonuclease/phosphatase family protein n=1 Tax=Riemerella anatipestifer TaxID=34085 RepID=UPI0030BDBB83